MNEEEIFNLYMSDLRRIDSSPLSGEEEVSLSERIREGDEQALVQLVEANLRFVIYVAGKFRNMGLSFPELVCYGNEGLMDAAKRFDGGRGFKFITYAVWRIKQSIRKALSDNSKRVRQEGISLDAPLDDEERDKCLYDFIGGDGFAEEVDRRVDSNFFKEQIRDLEPRDRYILERYYGSDGKKPGTLEEIGRELGGVNRESVRQFKNRVLRNIRERAVNY